jgi:hypothetical protein
MVDESIEYDYDGVQQLDKKSRCTISREVQRTWHGDNAQTTTKIKVQW